MSLKKGFFQMTKHEREIAMNYAKRSAQDSTGMTLTPEQVQDYILFRFVNNRFGDFDLLIKQGFAPKNTKNL